MARKLSVDAICRLIDALLRRGYPALEQIVQLLDAGPRTLRRPLYEQEISYTILVDRCR